MNQRFDARIGDNEYLFKEMLKQRRRAMGPGNRAKTKNFKSPKQFYPSQYEKKYSKWITSLIKNFTSITDYAMKYNLDNWIDSYNASTKKDSFILDQDWKEDFQDFILGYNNDSEEYRAIVDTYSKVTEYSFVLKNDDYSTEFRSFINELYDEQTKEFVINEASTRNFISSIGFDVSDFNEIQWQKQCVALLGTEFIVPEPWEIEVISTWTDTNFTLIKSLTDEYIKKVNTIISDGVQSGLGSKELKGQIKKLDKNISEYRANLIARDQVGKLNGLFEKRRQQEVGLDKYTWLTAGDERVRSTHKSMDGLICKWNDPTVYSRDDLQWNSRTSNMVKLHPGSDIQCFLGNTPFRSNILAKKLYRRLYTGEFAKIVTDNGVVFHCTINHPVLTRDRGMVPAKDLKIGEDIVCISDEGLDSCIGVSTFTQLNTVNRKVTFEQCFEFLSTMFLFLETMGSTEQFHGDGVIDTQVDIIDIERFLRYDNIPSINKNVLEEFFSHADSGLSFLIPDTDSSFCLHSLGFSSTRFISFFSKLFSFFNRESAHSDDISLGTISKINMIFNEYPIYNLSANRIFFGEGQDTEFSVDIVKNNVLLRKLFLIGWFSMITDKDIASITDLFREIVTSDVENSCDFRKGHTSFVHFNSVVDNSVSDFSTHVYNLENDLGQYSVTLNNIQVKNCRCNGAPYMDELIEEIDKELAEEQKRNLEAGPSGF